jgi:hypothetical protein
MKTGNPVRSACLAAAGALVLLSAPAIWAQNQGSVTREGRYWVQTVEGTLEAAPGGRLRGSSVGGIQVRGEAGNQLRYVAKKRLRAGAEAEAKRLL